MATTTPPYKGAIFVVLKDRVSPLGEPGIVWTKGMELKREVDLKDFDDDRLAINIKVGNFALKGDVTNG